MYFCENFRSLRQLQQLHVNNSHSWIPDPRFGALDLLMSLPPFFLLQKSSLYLTGYRFLVFHHDVNLGGVLAVQITKFAYSYCTP